MTQRRVKTCLVVLLTAPAINAYGQPAEREGLRLDVAFAPGDYLLGEPLPVRCSLVNASSANIVIPFHRYGTQSTFLFEIIDADGNQVHRLLFQRESVPRGVSIAAGARHVVSVDLYDEYGISQPGTYRIGVTFETDGVFYATGGVRKTGWKGSLSTPVGTVNIIMPSRPTDVAALQLLAVDSAHSTAPYRYALEDEARRSKLLQQEPDSAYANYARYRQVTAALKRFKDTTNPVFIGMAQEHLAAVKEESRPPLFREDVAFARLIVRAASGDMPAAQREFEAFKTQHPDSPRTLRALDSWSRITPNSQEDNEGQNEDPHRQDRK